MEKNDFVLIKRIFAQYVGKYHLNIVFAILAMILVASATGANAYLIQPMLDQIFINQNQQMLYFITGAVILTALVKGIASYFQSISMKSLGQRILTDMQMDLYDHMLHSDLALINNYSTGKLISRFTNDISIMRSTVSTLITGFARDIISIIFLIGVMFYQNWLLSLCAFTVFPIAIYPIIRLGKRMKKIAANTQEELSNYTAKLDESFQNLKIIKSYNREDFEITRAWEMIRKILNLYLRAARTEALSSPIMETLSGLAIGFVVWYGGSQVVSGITTAGSFFSFIAATIMAYKPIKSIADLNTSLQEGLAAAKRFFQLLDTMPHITDKLNAPNIQMIKGEIRFNNVSFKHFNRNQLFDQFNFVIPAGKTIAIVGESGGGKSTIINLLLRFCEPELGKIFIDDQDIGEVTLKSLRDNITLVTQEVSLFDDSIFNNIKYGRLEATDEEVIKAAELAMVYEYSKHLPNGLDTLIGQNGIHLSGGQRQRIAIARAILKNSTILIMDEASSALDSITEDIVFNNIQAIRKDYTTLIIAHRLSTIINADLIVVIDQGKVIEQGSHSELIKFKGQYFQLYQKYGNLND